MESKAKVNLREGLIELEGSEEFVSKYLEFFSNKIDIADQLKTKKKIEKETSVSESEKDQNKTRKRGAKKIESEEFDFEEDTSNSIVSLNEFLSSKKVNEKTTAPKFILAVGYYITNLKKSNEFSEGNIEFAYKALGITKRPVHLHQIIINQKNSKGWFEEGSSNDKWKLSRVGEIFVESSLSTDEVE